jgi:hypothetical protein
MSARNRAGLEKGQILRAAIKTILAAHSPLARPLTAKQINAKLPAPLRRSDRTIQWHMDAIYVEQEIACACRNSSADNRAA